ncbi:hypothetical protein HDU92_006219 [Lobulomyces angularis]|nr:hypothetical protein HDU92_006219 [Lobulomyces angularis]
MILQKQLQFGFNVSGFEDGFDRRLRGLCKGWLDDLTCKTNSREWELLNSEIWKEEQPEVWLLYGARYYGIEGDVCFENYLKDLKPDLRNFSLNLCLSRQEVGKGYFKGYVQNLIKTNQSDILNFINGDDAGIYVFEDLNAAFIDIINEQKLDVKGIEILSKLTEGKRYVREIWVLNL